MFANVKLKKVATKEVKDKLACPSTCKVIKWLNTSHLVSPDELETDRWLSALFSTNDQMRVALIDFFAYSCTNCVRTIGGIQRLHETYGSKGLVVVALHRPEFDFEREQANLEHFLASAGVTYLVGMDNNDTAWEAWDVSMWPTHFLVAPTKDGSIKKVLRGDAGAARAHADVQPANSCTFTYCAGLAVYCVACVHVHRFR